MNSIRLCLKITMKLNPEVIEIECLWKPVLSDPFSLGVAIDFPPPLPENSKCKIVQENLSKEVEFPFNNKIVKFTSYPGYQAEYVGPEIDYDYTIIMLLMITIYSSLDILFHVRKSFRSV